MEAKKISNIYLIEYVAEVVATDKKEAEQIFKDDFKKNKRQKAIRFKTCKLGEEQFIRETRGGRYLKV